VDRPAGDPGAARLDAGPGEAGRAALEREVPDPRDPRRRRGAGPDERPVRASGRQLLAAARLAPESRARVDSLRRLIEALDFEIDLFATLVARRLREHPGYRALLQIPGVGPVLAAVFVAEIGDVTRFARPAQLASWAGLTPKHHESDTTVHRGRITKQGSRLVRWAAVEAVQRVPAHTDLGALRDRVAARRGRNIGVVAAARELTELVYFGLRDGDIRRLSTAPESAA
jgi:transposase